MVRLQEVFSSFFIIFFYIIYFFLQWSQIASKQRKAIKGFQKSRSGLGREMPGETVPSEVPTWGSLSRSKSGFR